MITNQYILSFYVSMEDALVVEILTALGDLQDDGKGFLLGEMTVLAEIGF